MISSKVADLTIHEFEGLIKKVVMQTISEIFGDPDEGLEIHEELKNRLEHAEAIKDQCRKSRFYVNTETL